MAVKIKTTELCSYGCGQIAKYKLKNGKLCCSKSNNSCVKRRKQLSENEKNIYKTKPIPIETTELCSYGCGHVAKYKFKNGKLCCNNHINKCLMNRKKNKTQIPITTIKLCEYGCGQVAKYKFKNGKICCSKYSMKCLNQRKILSKKHKKIIYSKPIPIETTELCSYGCGQVAKFKLKNGKLCCSKNWNTCPEKRNQNSLNVKGTHIGIPIETTELCSYGCGQVAKYKLKNGKLCCSKSNNTCLTYKLTIDQIKKRYPTFYKEEDLKYNPAKPNEIQVRCKYNKCKNSKENNGWFTPTKSQMHERIRHLEKPWGNGGSYFYCSDECKEKCFLFGMNPNYIINNNQNTTSPHTSVELNIWRQEVLRRQKDEYGYNSCEMCESKENLQVHHEKPQKTHPGMTLDPDNGIILCKDCHYKYGHKTGTPCSTGNLANYNPC